MSAETGWEKKIGLADLYGTVAEIGIVLLREYVKPLPLHRRVWVHMRARVRR